MEHFLRHLPQARLNTHALLQFALKSYSGRGADLRLHGQRGRENDLERLTAKIANIDAQTEALAEHLAQIPKGVSPTPIFNQMKKLEETKEMLRAELGEIERTLDESAMPVELAGYEEFLAALKRGLNAVGEAAKAEIIQKLVSKVEVHPESVTVFYKVSKGETRPPEVAPWGSLRLRLLPRKPRKAKK